MESVVKFTFMDISAVNKPVFGYLLARARELRLKSSYLKYGAK